MTIHDIDKLLEASLSGDPPRASFQARVLNESLAALGRARRTRVRRQWLRFGVAAAFIASVSFFLGRNLGDRSVPVPAPVVAEPVETVMVSSELVAWLEAARLFRQLGMEDRMARAVEHAGKLLPADTFTAGVQRLPTFAAESVARQDERIGVNDALGPHSSLDIMNSILAQSVGD
jgi:hypothetical protein